MAVSRTSPSAFLFVFLQRLIDQVQPIIRADGNETGTKAIRLLEGGDVSLVQRGVVSSRIRNRRDDAEHLIAHSVEIVVVGEIAGSDDLDARVAEPRSANFLAKMLACVPGK